MKTEDKRAQEKNTMYFMVKLYCKKKHYTKKGLCVACKEVYEYALRRIDVCPFMETKSFCSNCNVHCYKQDMREKICEMMRFSGSRMLLYKPHMALHHVYVTIKEKRKK